MISVPEFLDKAADKCGFLRENYNEGDIPTTVSNVTILPFFGDTCLSFVLSCLLFKSYRERIRGSKYFIVASWPGHKILYPGANEYWSVKDASLLRGFYSKSNGLINENPATMNYMRLLNQFFDDVINIDSLKAYYSLGLGDDYIAAFGKIERSMPMIPSSGVLGADFNRMLANNTGYKILVCPTLYVKSWRNHGIVNIKTQEDFWVSLIDRLKNEGYTPVVVNNYTTHDLSARLSDGCIVFNDTDLSKLLCVMRSVNCVLDVFNDFSKWAILARSPFVSCTERQKYIKAKDYEIDDLTCLDMLPKQYIFSFTTILESAKEVWDISLFDNIIARLNKFIPEIDRSRLPTGSAITEEVSYEKVRIRKIKRLGARYIKVRQD